MQRRDVWKAMVLAAFALAACGPEAPESDGARAGPPGAIGPAIREALAVGSRLDRLHRLTGVLAFLDAENIDEAVELYDREQPMLPDAEVEVFFEAWSRFDPASAVAHAASLANPRFRGRALAAAVQGWAVREPQEAARGVEELQETYPRMRNLLLASLVTGWAHSGDPGVVEYVANSPEDVHLLNGAALVGAQTRRLGVPGVLRWADGVLDGLPDGKLREGVFAWATSHAMPRDPTTTAAWVDAHVGQGYPLARVVRIVMEHWLPIDAEAALAWASESPAASGRDRPIRAALSNWMSQDIERASEWLESAAPAPDPAIEAYARVLAPREPDAALRWAERIRDADRRLESLKWVIAGWYRRDPVAAEAWLQQSSLDEEVRLEVRQSPAREPDRAARRAF